MIVELNFNYRNMERGDFDAVHMLQTRVSFIRKLKHEYCANVTIS